MSETPATYDAQVREDSAFLNLLVGLQSLGGINQNSGYALSDSDCDREYRFNPFAAKLIDLLPDAMTQKWAIYKCADLTPEQVSAMQRLLDRAAPHYNKALKAARKYGGGAILLGLDDGISDYSQPVDEYNLRSISFLTVLEKPQLSAVDWCRSPYKKNFGKPETYRLSADGTIIHHSRLLVFHGTELGMTEMQSNGGWGDSILTRIYTQMKDFLKAHEGVFASLKDFNQRVLKMRDLARLMTNAQGKQNLRDRLTQTSLALSSYGMMAIDAENEDYGIVARQYGGVLDILKQAGQIFAGATDLPPSKLMSIFSASGLASEDTTQQRYWSEYVNIRQNDQLLPAIEYHVRLLHLCSDSPTQGQNPPFEIGFLPSFQLTEAEEKDLDFKEAQRHDIYLKHQVVFPDEVAEALARRVPLEDAINLKQRYDDRRSIVQYPEGQARNF